LKKTRFLRVLRDSLILISGYSRLLFDPKPKKRVICFHDIEARHQFRDKMVWLKENYDIAFLEELLTRSPDQKAMIAVTFDDGYTSWHEIAAPVLEDLHIPATFFVCSGFIGLHGEEEKQFIRKCLRRQQDVKSLTKTQLSDLANCPLFKIGGHTVHHIDLGQCGDKERFEFEIHGDRQRLQDWTGKAIRWFAYPFGMKHHISDAAIEVVEKARFMGAFTLIPQFLDEYTDRFRIGRDGFDVEDSGVLWRAWLQGGYDSFYGFKENFRRTKGGG